MVAETSALDPGHLNEGIEGDRKIALFCCRARGVVVTSIPV